MLSKTAGWGWSFLGRLVNSWGEFLSLLLVVKCSFRISSLECMLRQTLSYLKCQTGSGKLLTRKIQEMPFNSQHLLWWGASSYELLFLRNLYAVSCKIRRVCGSMKLFICPCHFKARWYWKNGQDLLVGICTTVLPATGWQCLTKKTNHIWGNKQETHPLLLAQEVHISLWVYGFLESEEEENILLY